jgi:hypothetical protein
MAWKFPQTIDRVVFEADILKLLGESPSLSEFELRRQVLMVRRMFGPSAEQNAEMFKAALRSLVRKAMVTFDGRYRLADVRATTL